MSKRPSRDQPPAGPSSSKSGLPRDQDDSDEEYLRPKLGPSRSKLKRVISDPEDSDDGAEEAPRKSKGKQRAKAAKKTRELSPAVPEDVESGLSLGVTPIEIEQTPHLKNWKRWAAVKDSLKLTSLVQGKLPASSLTPDRLDALLKHEPVEGQDWGVEKIRFVKNSELDKVLFSNQYGMESDYWMIQVTNAAATRQIQDSYRQAWVAVQVMPTNDAKFARRIGDELCKMLTHLPIPGVTIRATDVTGQFLTLVALRKADGQRKNLSYYVGKDLVSLKKFTAFNVAWDRARKTYLAKLLTYDRNLNIQGNNTRIRIKPDEISEDASVPELPEALVALMPEVTYPKEDFNSFSDADQKMHRRGVRLCHYVQYVMFGACGDKKILSEQAHNIVAVHSRTEHSARSKRNSQGLSTLYKGSKLFAIRRQGSQVDIMLSPKVRHDLTGPSVPRITISGCNKRRVSTVLEHMTQKYLRGCNVVDAWQAGCLKADSINTMPASQSFMHCCDHEEAERDSVVHICQNCLCVVFCANMVFAEHVGLRVCLACVPHCNEIEVVTVSRGESNAQTGPKIDRVGDNFHEQFKGPRFRNKMLKALRRELTVPSGDSLAVRQGVADRIAKRWLDEETETWEDQFIDQRRPDTMPKVTGTRTSGLVSSPDAATIFHIEDGRASYHHEKTMVPTAAYANQATYTWPKVTLQILRDALPLRESPDYFAYRDINNRFDHAWAVRTKYPFRVKTRLEITMDDQQYAHFRDEMRRGILDEPEEIVPYGISYKSVKGTLWTLDDRERINGLIDQMLARKSGPIDLPRGADDTPFPWRPEHIPPDWSWERLEAHMAWHFDLMDRWCDWYFETDEIPKTLLLELIWQWIDNGGRDPWWRLPMTLYVNHPTAWAIGHIHHGQAMRTGWPTNAIITDISQREDSLCNVVIEPRIVNYLKMAYSEDEYEPMLRDLLEGCKDETEWFVRPSKEVTPVNIEYSRIKALRRAAQWVKREYDDDAGYAGDFVEVDANELEDDFDEDFGDEEDVDAFEEAENEEDVIE